MQINWVMDEVASKLSAITGLNVHAYPPDSFSPPAAIVLYPSEIRYDQTYGRGLTEIDLDVFVLVGGVADSGVRDRVTAYASDTGPSSFKVVLEDNSYTAFHELTIVTSMFDKLRWNGVDYWAGLFSLTIAGSGK